MNTFIDVLKKIQMHKTPHVFCFSFREKTQEVIIDKISLTPIKNRT